MLPASDTIIKQSPFSIDALLRDSKTSLDNLLQTKSSSVSPSSQPVLSPQLIFPHLQHPPVQMLNTGEGPLPSNLPFDLLARSYMNGILGE